MYRRHRFRNLATMKGLTSLLIAVLTIATYAGTAQTGKPTVIRPDSTTQTRNPAFANDSSVRIVNGDTIKTASTHSPRTATLRSLVLPGWGQAYNKEYWKIPIVYAAIGTMAGFWVFNNMWYKRTKEAY